jgi:hypothetical protein
VVQQPPDLNDPVRWSLIKRKANETRAANAFQLFRENGIEPILIKGVAAATYYPPDHFRDAIDLDLAVDPQDGQRAKELLVSSREAASLGVDLHSGMRHLDPLDWSDLVANTETLPMAHGSIRVLRREDHLRILCVHWLTDGGANRERLWDITYAIKGRPPEFDWHRFLDVVDAKRRRWLESAVAIARDAHSLDLSDTPLAVSEAPRWMRNFLQKEWESETDFQPLRNSLDSWESFWSQFRKRFPPNPITATILSGGDIDAPTRIHYQIATTLSRALPSIKDVAAALRSKLQRRKVTAACF